MASSRLVPFRPSTDHLVGRRSKVSLPQERLVTSWCVFSPNDSDELNTNPGTGGWWVRPSNWASNTAVAMAGIVGVTFAIWSVSAEKEVRG